MLNDTKSNGLEDANDLWTIDKSTNLTKTIKQK